MPLYVLMGRDAPDSAEMRAETRPAHLEYWKSRPEAPRLVFAGPMLDEAGEKPHGSLIIFEAADLEQARDLADLDPYKLKGVFGEVEVHPVRQVAPEA